MADQDTSLGALASPLEFGKYELVERLALEPFTEVFRAKSQGIEGFERFVSLRRLRPSADAETIRTFVETAKRASGLRHANIAQVVDLGAVDHTYYAAAEFVEGPTLQQLTSRVDGEIAVAVACHVAIRVLEGLEYAHNRTDEAGHSLELLHNGLAPHDVGVSREGQVKLLNFGAASFRRSPGSHGVEEDRRGYMSPEQVRGLPLDRRSDTFAVGIILHELLTGRRLFEAATEFETLEKIRKVEVTPPTLLNPNVPAALEEVVLRALAKNPAERYPTAREMAHELQRFVFQTEAYASDADLRDLVAGTFPDGDWTASRPAPAPAAPAAAALPPVPTLDWDDDEEATSVFSRGDSAPIPRRPTEQQELGEWSRDLATGVHRGASTSQRISPVVTPAPVPEDEVPTNVVDPSDPIEVPAPAAEAPAAPEPVVHTPTAKKPAQSPSAPAKSPAARNDEPRRGGGLIIAAAVAAVAAVAIALLMGRQPPSQALQVIATPAGVDYTVTVDGRVVHEGPLPYTLEAEPGEHEVALRTSGYRPYTGTVNLTAGENATVNWALERAPHTRLPFRTTPAGATLTINGVEIGTTPTTAELPIGETAEVSLTLDGFTTHSARFVVSERSAPVTIALAPVAGAMAAALDAGNADAVAEADTAPDAPEGETDAEVDTATAEADTAADEALAEAAEPTEPVVAEPPTEPVVAAVQEPTSERAEPEPERTAEPEPDRDTEREAREEAEREAARQAEREARREREREEREAERRREEQAAQAAQAAPVGPPGFINVQSQPPATVIIDGETVGQTPLNGIPLAPGRHRVQLLNAAAGVDRTYRVSIDSGEARTIVNRTP